MPRRGKSVKRTINPDAKFNSVMVQTLINKVMHNGKKSTAERIVYQAMDQMAERTKEDPRQIVEQAIRNTMPILEVRPRRVGGATYQIPIEVRPDRSQALAIRWLIRASRSRSEFTMTERLANELLDAAANRGSAVKKREDTHRMAEANRAFSHYRW